MCSDKEIYLKMHRLIKQSLQSKTCISYRFRKSVVRKNESHSEK